MALCVCKRKWAGEAMLCCKVCDNWFHPECVGMSSMDFAAHTADPESQWECTSCTAAAGKAAAPATAALPAATLPPVVAPSTDEPLFCVCQQPWRGEEMLECDSCGGWFHPLCQNMSDADYLRLFAPESLGLLPAKTPPKWSCWSCKRARARLSTKGPDTAVLPHTKTATTRPAAKCNAATAPAANTTMDVGTQSIPANASTWIAQGLPNFPAAVEAGAAAAAAELQSPAEASTDENPGCSTSRADRTDKASVVVCGSSGSNGCGSNSLIVPQTTRWPVGRTRRRTSKPRSGITFAMECSSIALELSSSAPSMCTNKSKTAAEESNPSRRDGRRVTSALPTANANEGNISGSGNINKAGRRSSSRGWVGTHRRGGLPGAREEGAYSGNTLYIGKGSNCMPGWWEEDLQRLAREERQRQCQQQRLPKRQKRQKCHDPGAKVEHANINVPVEAADAAAHGDGGGGGGEIDAKQETSATSAAPALSDEVELSQCPICLGVLVLSDAGSSSSDSSKIRATARTPCSHAFCRKCLMAALTRCSGPPRCPLCRRNLSRFLQQLQRSAVVKVDLF